MLLITPPSTSLLILLPVPSQPSEPAPVPEQMCSLTTSHHIPVSQPWAPSCLLRIMQCPLTVFCFHFHLVDSSTQQQREPPRPSHHSPALSPPIPACVTQMNLKPFHSAAASVSLLPSQPHLLARLPYSLTSRLRPSPFPAHVSRYPPRDLCTRPSLCLKCSSPKHLHSCFLC